MSAMTNKLPHQPKGSMCMACVHSSRGDCSQLDFRSMPVIYRESDAVIVKCTDFRQKLSPCQEHDRALDQMERGMGASSTPASRAAVNAETLAARSERELELVERRNNRAELPAQKPAKTGEQRLQDGEFGRLD